MKLKLVSDGTPFNTHVCDAETGERIEGIQKVEFAMDVDGLSVMQITVFGGWAEITHNNGNIKVEITPPETRSLDDCQHSNITVLIDRSVMCQDCGKLLRKA